MVRVVSGIFCGYFVLFVFIVFISIYVIYDSFGRFIRERVVSMSVREFSGLLVYLFSGLR